MKYYMAPMEGVTTQVYRRVYHKYFDDIDCYFTPFLASKKLSGKEKREIDPEINKGMKLVPQILSNQVDTFLAIAKQLEDLGYETVNLNLGCPSGTVVSRKRGSGQLQDLIALDRFLDELFTKCPMKISIKTRIGMYFLSEWEEILEVYKKYPLEELIVHPRLQKEMYGGKVHLDEFGLAYGQIAPLCFNGDVFTEEAQQEVLDRFPQVDAIMLGRGLFRRPGLAGELRVNTIAGNHLTKSREIPPFEEMDISEVASRERSTKKLLAFMEELLEEYRTLYGPGQDTNVLFKMKDVWNFMAPTYADREKELKSIRKSQNIPEYRAAVRSIFS